MSNMGNATNTGSNITGTAGNPITFKESVPLKETSGLGISISITPLIDGSEVSGVKDYKLTFNKSPPPFTLEVSYKMPFSSLPQELQQQLLEANSQLIPTTTTTTAATEMTMDSSPKITMISSDGNIIGGPLSERVPESKPPINPNPGLERIKTVIVKGYKVIDSVGNIFTFLEGTNLLDEWGANVKKMESIYKCLDSLLFLKQNVIKSTEIK